MDSRLKLLRRTVGIINIEKKKGNGCWGEKQAEGGWSLDELVIFRVFCSIFGLSGIKSIDLSLCCEASKIISLLFQRLYFNPRIQAITTLNHSLSSRTDMDRLNTLFRGQGMGGPSSAPPGAVSNIPLISQLPCLSRRLYSVSFTLSAGQLAKLNICRTLT